MKKIDKGTVLRTVLQTLAYVNQFVALLGSTTFANSPVYQWVSFGLTILITAVSYWYNNDWSKLAIASRDVFDMLKDGKITKEELDKFVEDHRKEN